MSWRCSIMPRGASGSQIVAPASPPSLPPSKRYPPRNSNSLPEIATPAGAPNANRGHAQEPLDINMDSHTLTVALH